jgi:hypothetical protein
VKSGDGEESQNKTGQFGCMWVMYGKLPSTSSAHSGNVQIVEVNCDTSLSITFIYASVTCSHSC